MRRIAGTVLVVALLGLAFAGQQIAAKAEGVPGSGGHAAAASTQLLGSLRAVPQMALWRRILEAEQREDWHELVGLFDLVLGLTPKSAQVVVQLAHTEALMAARNQPDPESEWAWIERGLRRMSEARPSVGNPGIVDDGIWTVGFHAGHRHPAKVAVWIWVETSKSEKVAAARALDAEIEASPAARAFLAEHWLSTTFVPTPDGEGAFLQFWETDAFRALPLDAQDFLIRAERERWLAMREIAERGLRDMRGTGSRLMFEYWRTLSRLATWAEGDERLELVTALRETTAREVTRLEALGDHATANMLREAMSAEAAGRE